MVSDVHVKQRTQIWPVAIGAVVVATRLPFLGHGYGEDPDSWRAIIAAQHLLDTGRYVPSRPPGYPLPEYVDAVMLWAGLGSSFWIGMLSAVLCGVAAALTFALLQPLGTGKAVVGGAALAFTPQVFVASISAMDFMWGLSFFLAAALCVTRNRWWAAVFLGLAIASRPTYAVAALPLVVLCIGFDVHRLRTQWKSIVLPLIFSAVIALAFFAPAIISTGSGLLAILDAGSDRWLRVAYQGSIGMFGIGGFLGVAVMSVYALIKFREAPKVNAPHMDTFAFTTIAVWGLLFIRLPHDAAYLIPALVGLYWLLCRYVDEVVLLWAMVALLAEACFVGHVDSQTRKLGFAGPVIRAVQEQDERRCVADLVRDELGRSPDLYIITGVLRPQLLLEVGSDRLLYTVRSEDGRLIDTEWVPFPQDADLAVLDRVEKQQNTLWDGHIRVLSTLEGCPLQ